MDVIALEEILTVMHFPLWTLSYRDVITQVVWLFTNDILVLELSGVCDVRYK